MIAPRRRFLFGAGASLLVAPAIVRVAANLMPVSTAAVPVTPGLRPWLTAAGMADFNQVAIRVWSERLLREALKATAIQQMIVDGNALDALISVKLRVAA